MSRFVFILFFYYLFVMLDYNYSKHPNKGRKKR